MRGGSRKLAHTVEEYANHTTIHGISYIFDKELSLAGRLLWALLVLGFCALASALTWDTWTQWQENQVHNLIMNEFEFSYLFLIGEM